jgi:hypothetical protein
MHDYLTKQENILRGEKNTMLEEKCEINCGRATGLTYSEIGVRCGASSSDIEEKSHMFYKSIMRDVT